MVDLFKVFTNFYEYQFSCAMKIFKMFLIENMIIKQYLKSIKIK